MDESIEMSYLSKTVQEDDAPSPQSPGNATVTWTYGAAFLLLCSAFCLTIYPRFLLFMSESASSSERRVALTPLESFLAFHSGIWLAAIAFALLLNLPDSENAAGSVGHPLLGSLTVAASMTAFISYNTKYVGPLAFVVFLGSAAIGLWGFWVIIFGTSYAISKTTGADKRTSSFLFGNKSAASAQKKRWRREQKKS